MACYKISRDNEEDIDTNEAASKIAKLEMIKNNANDG